jgi:molecular chaperone DnaJ
MFTTPCPRCQGQGVVIKEQCKSCKGHGAVERERKVVVAFPPGIDGGQKLRIPGQGMPGPAGASPGDLYVEIDVAEDGRFERDGADLVTRVHVSFADAALGAEVRVPALGESLEDPPDTTVPCRILPGTQSGSVFTLKGQGVPRLDGRGRGSLVAVVQVDVPTVLSDRAKALLHELEVEFKRAGGTPEPGKARAAGAK